MDKIVGLIVIVLAWHMSVDASVKKVPKLTSFLSARAVFSQKLLKNCFLINTIGLLVTNGQYCWSCCPSVGLAHVWG